LFFFFNDTATTEIYTPFPTRRSSDLGRGFSSRMSEITVNRDRHLDNVVSQAEDIQAGVRRSADRTIIQPAWFSAGMAGLRTTSQVMNIEQGIAKAGAGG